MALKPSSAAVIKATKEVKSSEGEAGPFRSLDAMAHS